MKTTAKVLCLLGAGMAVFITAMCIIFCVKGTVPDTLIQCTLGTGGLEALLLAFIKISRIISGEERNE